MFDGEFDVIVLLVYVLEQLLLMVLFDDYSSVVYISPRERCVMWGLSDGFFLKLLHEEVCEITSSMAVLSVEAKLLSWRNIGGKLFYLNFEVSNKNSSETLMIT